MPTLKDCRIGHSRFRVWKNSNDKIHNPISWGMARTKAQTTAPKPMKTLR
jgi:hypothetical protein